MKKRVLLHILISLVSGWDIHYSKVVFKVFGIRRRTGSSPSAWGLWLSYTSSCGSFSHPSTNQARPCLASEIRRDRARSGWCGRRRPVVLSFLLPTPRFCIILWLLLSSSLLPTSPGCTPSFLHLLCLQPEGYLASKTGKEPLIQGRRSFCEALPNCNKSKIKSSCLWVFSFR